MASFYYNTSLTIQQNPVIDLNQGLDEDGQFEFVHTELLRFSKRNGDSAAVELGRNSIEISLSEVVTEEESQILELRERLVELGVPAEVHARMIAQLLDHIHSVVIPGPFDPWMTVVMTIEQITGSGGLVVEEQSEVALLEDGIVKEVMELREEMNLWRQMQPQWPLRATAADDDDLDLVFDEAVSQSMEVVTVRTMPVSEAAIISRLEKVQQRELDFVPSCSICMDDEDKHEFARMPCTHLFHHECIATWLTLNDTCPLCRFPMPI